MISSRQPRSGLVLRRFRSRRSKPEILIAPLIDIVFLLLIFFMLITRFLAPSVALALPESEYGLIDESRSVCVSVDVDGNVYLDDQTVTLDALSILLDEKRVSGEIEIVRLRADRETDWQFVVDTMDAIRAGGILDIAIETVRAGQGGAGRGE